MSTRFDEKLAAKKAAVIGARRRNRLPLWGAGAAFVLVLAAAGAGYLYFGDAPDAPAPAAEGSVAEGMVTLPAARFDDGKAHFFEHRQGGVAIRYFVVKSPDGVLRAAFDACDVCWPAGKGYAQEGDTMVCRNCGLRFDSNRVNEVKGGCNPAPLQRRVEDGKLLIRVSDILEGRGYFDFSKRG
ncbi:MAG: DUF2318 domain-containing protein [Desulfobacterales bacterium]|jgi:uncharacterized membrane protein|nr:DUF2318 domain-containing protein [Desulfobacterales bacterium]